MKKFFSFIIAVMAVCSVSAANHVESSKLFDNVSITVKGGITTPLSNPVDYPRGIFGIELQKMITPVFGMGLEGEWTANTSSWKGMYYSPRMIDHQYIGAFSNINLMNLFKGYNGQRRTFELETVLGVGWGHAYNAYAENVVMTKAGVNINFNLGKEKAWMISLKPAVVWNVVDNHYQCNYDINRAALQLQAGVTYHFKNSDGNRFFTLCDKVATQSEIDELNNTINELRRKNYHDQDVYNNQLQELISANKSLSDALVECSNREIKGDVNISPCQFEYNSYKIPETNKALLKDIAKYIKETDSSIQLIGYASEEGSDEYNDKLSLNRAKAVRDFLIENGVSTEKIAYEGRGKTTQFGEAPYNRVVITVVK